MGKERKRLTIGRYPIISLADARVQAKRILANRTLNKHEPERITFEAALGEFVAQHLSQTRPKTAIETERLLRKHFLPPLKDKSLGDIRTHEITSVLDDLIEKPSLANHAHVAIGTFFRFAVRRRHLSHAPTEGLRSPAKTQASRDRVLSGDELKRVWIAAEQCGTFGIIVKLLILSGQRRGEIAALHAEWISQDSITLPSWLTKNNKEHTFPLGSFAQPIVSRACSVSQSGLLFPARGRAHQCFNGWSKSKAALDKLSGITDWTLHDLRRTFATGLAALGTPIHVTEKILNHVSGTTGGLVAVYQRHQFWNEQVAAVAAWENKLKALISIS